MVKDLVFCSLLLYFFPGYCLKGTERGPGVTWRHCSRVWLWGKVVFLVEYQSEQGIWGPQHPSRLSLGLWAKATEDTWSSPFTLSRSWGFLGNSHHLPSCFSFSAESHRTALAAPKFSCSRKTASSPWGNRLLGSRFSCLSEENGWCYSSRRIDHQGLGLGKEVHYKGSWGDMGGYGIVDCSGGDTTACICQTPKKGGFSLYISCNSISKTLTMKKSRQRKVLKLNMSNPEVIQVFRDTSRPNR